MNLICTGLVALLALKKSFCSTQKFEDYGNMENMIHMDASYTTKKINDDGCFTVFQTNFPAKLLHRSISSSSLLFGVAAVALSFNACISLETCHPAHCEELDVAAFADLETTIARFGVGTALVQLIFLLLNAISKRERSELLRPLTGAVLLKGLIYAMIFYISESGPGDLKIEFVIILVSAMLESMISSAHHGLIRCLADLIVRMCAKENS